MKIRFKKWYFFVTVIIIFVMYLFWGPLFPWNPIKLGYTKIKSSKATVYIKEFNGDSVVYKLNEIIQEEEEFHGLEFQKKFKIIILGKESNMKRYLPWLKGNGYSVKLGFMNVIYIGSNARNSPFGIDAFLKHEISHLLIHQNTPSSSNNMEIVKQGWLAEGVATYFGGPHYYEKEYFVELWRGNGLQFNNLYMENPHEMDRNIIKLKYTYYRFFIEFLIETYSLEKLQTFIKIYSEKPQKYKEIFIEIYNKKLNEILSEFDSYMNH